jgi:ribosomal protein S11
MFTVTSLTTHASSATNGVPYANELADLQLPFVGITAEYINPTPDSLLITTNTPSFIQSGTGNDTVIDQSKTTGDVVIDPSGGANTVQASSNPTSHDTVIVDAESDAPLTDVITGLKAGDNVVIKGLTALSPGDFANATVGGLQGLMLTTHVPVGGPAAQVFLSGYNAGDLAAGGRLSAVPFAPPSSMPEASSYLRLHVGP